MSSSDFRIPRSASTLACLTAIVLTATAAGSDWPQFRGPQARGVDDSAPGPVRWNVGTGDGILWKTAIPGLAHASPILWGGRVYVATAAGPDRADLRVGLYGDIAAADDQGKHQWRLLCLDDATGRILWNTLGHEGVPRVRRHTKASHCNSTPATDGKRLVAIFGSEGLFAFDMEGNPLWTTDLGPMDSGFFRVASAQWGFASSPVLHEGRVVVLCDVQEGSYLATFDAATGREIWRTARSDVPTWGTPTVVSAGDRTRILVNGWHHSGAYDFETGEEIWRHDGGGDIPVPTPVVAHGMAYFTSAHGRFRPIQAIRLEARGDITAEELGDTSEDIVWSHPRRGNYMQTPIVVGDLLFACQDNGILSCFDARTGESHYQERLRSGSAGFTASPVSDGHRLYFPGEDGDVYVVPVDRQFSTIATNRMEETVMASPAVSKGRLYFRTRDAIVAVGGEQISNRSHEDRSIPDK